VKGFCEGFRLPAAHWRFVWHRPTGRCTGFLSSCLNISGMTEEVSRQIHFIQHDEDRRTGVRRRQQRGFKEMRHRVVVRQHSVVAGQPRRIGPTHSGLTGQTNRNGSGSPGPSLRRVLARWRQFRVVWWSGSAGRVLRRIACGRPVAGLSSHRYRHDIHGTAFDECHDILAWEMWVFLPRGTRHEFSCGNCDRERIEAEHRLRDIRYCGLVQH
jgi:hypothetical protein